MPTLKNLLSNFGKAKRTIIILAIFFGATVAVSFHDDILWSRNKISQPATTTSPGGTPTAGTETSRREKLWDLAEKLLMTICALLIIHLFDQVYLMGEITQNMRAALDTVVHRHVHLIESCDKSGIADIYVNRHDGNESLTNDIQNSVDRLWLLGVGLNVRVNLRVLLPKLKKKVKAGVDVRVLMLDAFRSTAVFRTFLESNGDQVERMLKYYEPASNRNPVDPSDQDAYFSTTLCNEFEATCRALQNTPELEACIKFYAHTPTCWLVIADNKAYFQPYTFGNGLRDHEADVKIHDTQTGDETIGDLLPVFKFKRHKNTGTFNVLEDHFLKLWATSDCSLFHIKARCNDKKEIVRKIFKARSEWLRHVYNMLFTKRGRESYDKRPGARVSDKSGKRQTLYRLYERQICPEPVVVNFRFRSQGEPDNAGSQLFEAKILDSSRDGLALATNHEFERFAIENDVLDREVEISLVALGGPAKATGSPNLVEFLGQILLQSNNSFAIKNVSEMPATPGRLRVGLRKVA